MKMLVKAYGDAAMKRTALHIWYSRYENGYESVIGEQRSGRPTSITSQKVQEIKELLDKDRRISVREVSQRVDCSVGTVHTIIHENLNMSRFLLVPHTEEDSARQFDDVADLQRAVQSAIAFLGPSACKNCFYSWVKMCRKCISFKGEYFEKDECL